LRISLADPAEATAIVEIVDEQVGGAAGVICGVAACSAEELVGAGAADHRVVAAVPEEPIEVVSTDEQV
jgi:hypothetical protein